MKFERSHLFFDTDVTLINEWLQTALPYFPKSLEIIQFSDCEVTEAANPNPELCFTTVANMIMPHFYDALPNLREITLNFEEEGWYGGEEFCRSDGALGRCCSDGNVRFSWFRIDQETGDEIEDSQWFLH